MAQEVDICFIYILTDFRDIFNGNTSSHYPRYQFYHCHSNSNFSTVSLLSKKYFSPCSWFVETNMNGIFPDYSQDIYFFRYILIIWKKNIIVFKVFRSAGETVYTTKIPISWRKDKIHFMRWKVKSVIIDKNFTLCLFTPRSINFTKVPGPNAFSF